MSSYRRQYGYSSSAAAGSSSSVVPAGGSFISQSGITPSAAARTDLDIPKVRNIAARKIVDALLADPCSRCFRVLPDPYIHSEYYGIIQRPISLADIRDFAMGFSAASPPSSASAANPNFASAAAAAQLGEDAVGPSAGGRYSLADIQRDLRRMVANAKRYNQADSQIYQEALALEVGFSLGTILPLPACWIVERY
jgi:Bromodomain